MFVSTILQSHYFQFVSQSKYRPKSCLRFCIKALKVQPQGRGEARVVPRSPLNLLSDVGCLGLLLFFRASSKVQHFYGIKHWPQGHRFNHQFMELDFIEPIVPAPTSIFSIHQLAVFATVVAKGRARRRGGESWVLILALEFFDHHVPLPDAAAAICDHY